MAISEILIDDPIDKPEQGAIEVTVSMESGEKRWCFFMTPERLALVGDWVSGTQVRVYLGVPHMIVVSEISSEIINQVLLDLSAEGEILKHTLPLA